MKIPFGIAQIGKAFRNEIIARNFIFRTREFEQMEMQYFVKPGTDDSIMKEWKEKRFQFYLDQLCIVEKNYAIKNMVKMNLLTMLKRPGTLNMNFLLDGQRSKEYIIGLIMTFPAMKNSLGKISTILTSPITKDSCPILLKRLQV